jgi:hypothetical protein
MLVFQTLIGVYNYDNHGEVNSESYSAAVLCAEIKNFTTYSELAVYECPFPESAGPYWILYFNDTSGLGLVSGGPPTISTPNGQCKTGEGVDGSGLWIFTREQVRHRHQ